MKKEVNPSIQSDIELSKVDEHYIHAAYYRSKETWSLSVTDVTHPSKEIVTVPDESFTILELIDRSRKGLPLTGNAKSPVWNDTEDFDSPDLDEISRLDVIDGSEILNDMAERAHGARQAMIQQEQERKQRIADRKAAKAAEHAPPGATTPNDETKKKTK